ncbi:MAG: DUF1684 domain-containing protein [Actinomycetota bacterium]|nr:DUF1684 domain-containing protein [Actinomycetota bacterium]
MSAPLDERLQLLDWKRRVFSLYADVRSSPDARKAWVRWRAARDDLFKNHPQSPLPPEQRQTFEGLQYFDYDDTYRVQAAVDSVEPDSYEVPTSGDESFSFTRVGIASLELKGSDTELEVYWLEEYGGGLFIPFRDATSGTETYGAGRYLYDTIKGADLGSDVDRLVFDFNFAYNPSCSYDPRWICPLAPPPNRFAIPIRAGERHIER